VVNEKEGLPIPGVNIQIKNSKKGATDFDGKFSLKVFHRDRLVLLILVLRILNIRSQEIILLTVSLVGDKEFGRSCCYWLW
jgi:hypothetical protein